MNTVVLWQPLASALEFISIEIGISYLGLLTGGRGACAANLFQPWSSR